MLQKKIFAYNFRRLLKENNFDQATLSFCLNITQASVCKWARGESLPRPEITMRLAATLRCEVYDFWQRVPEGELPFRAPDGRHLRKLKNAEKRKQNGSDKRAKERRRDAARLKRARAKANGPVAPEAAQEPATA